jgi:hypothetical protein
MSCKLQLNINSSKQYFKNKKKNNAGNFRANQYN